MQTLWMKVAAPSFAQAPASPCQPDEHKAVHRTPSAVAEPSFNTRRLPNEALLAVSAAGDHTFLTDGELTSITGDVNELPIGRRAELQAKFVLPSVTGSSGTARLLKSRQAARNETISRGPSLHIIVPTLQCAHTCRYCQVSRSLSDVGHTISVADLEAACDSVFESQADSLTVEFQGGDPLLRFDLVEHAIERIASRNLLERRRLRFVVASTLHQLDESMCRFFAKHDAYLSTSIDGPAWLHNKNRPTPTRDSYERTLRGVGLAQVLIGPDSISALMTTTKESLTHPEVIVDEYVRLGLKDIFLRPLSAYGFAKRNQPAMAYTLEEFGEFYRRGLDRVLHWNRRGVEIREVYTSILLNKALSTFDSGYVDLQSPTGAGSSVLVYNYDGYVYPSDEARMLAETGETSLRMGRIGAPLSTLATSDVRQSLVVNSTSATFASCRSCAYKMFCAPNPVDALAQHGCLDVEPVHTEHCQRHTALFDEVFMRLQAADSALLDLFHRWARPNVQLEAA
jgi:His-Xaa-Ser system radical SAM maturase HxsB